MTQTHVRSLCLLIIGGFLIAGLWPFNFSPRNRLEWLSNERGVQFKPLSIIRSQGLLDLGNVAGPPASAGAITLELLLTAEIEPTGNTFSILSLYNGELPENLLVAQWKSGLLLRTPVWEAQGRGKYRETGVDGALQKGRQRFIAITSGPGGTFFYVDGVRAEAYPKVFVRPDALRGQLILGDNPEGSHSWTGRLFGLAAFNRSLGASDILRHQELWNSRRGGEIASEPGVCALFLFDEARGRTIQDRSPYRNALLIPESYRVLRKTVLVPPWQDSLHWHDIAINILGFVPFGFFYFVYRTMLHPGRRFSNAVLAILAGGLISAAIELTQVFIPTRSSSLADLICNILGSAIGVLARFLILGSCLFFANGILFPVDLLC